MSRISALSNSRGNYIETLRPQGSDRKAEKLAEKAEMSAAKEAENFAKAQAKVGKDQIDVSRKPEATEKPQTDVELGKRLDELDSKYSEVSRKLAAALGNRRSRADSTALGSRFDSQLNNFTNQLGDQLDDVVDDLSTAITELKEVVRQRTANNQAPYQDAVRVLKNDFNQQLSEPKAQHESETLAQLEKLNEVTEQLKNLSEQSSEQMSVFKDQLGGLGSQLGTIISKLDLLGKGQNVSLRTIGLFDVAAKAGNNALDKLIGIVGPNSTGNQLRSVQSRLQSVSARFGGGQPTSGLSLLA